MSVKFKRQRQDGSNFSGEDGVKETSLIYNKNEVNCDRTRVRGSVNMYVF